MLDPRPARRERLSRPTKVISKSTLLAAWKETRDSRSKPGRPGIDNETAQQFSSKLDSNLAEIARRIKRGDFGFSELRAVFVPKPHSDKERIICIPTVRDRLVQRTIAAYIVKKKLFPIYHESSFGFIGGKSVIDAVHMAIHLREEYDWCLKTDIEAFFDRVPRPYLKEQVKRYLKKTSLVSIVCQAIDCEARVTPKNRSKFEKQNLKRGCGVRQGMPLSPLLANLALVEFDQRVAHKKIKMVRYADDIALFFKSKEDAEQGAIFVANVLRQIELTIPKIAAGSKTQVISRSEPLSFLGREIVLSSKCHFVARVSDEQIDKIKLRLAEKFALSERLKGGKNFQDTVGDLAKSISAYLGIYLGVYNYAAFEAELKGQAQHIIAQLFEQIFGSDTLRQINDQGRKFLGLEQLNEVEANSDFEF